MRKAPTKASDEAIAARKRNMRNMPTKAEHKLWTLIKDKSLGVKFLRQERLGGRNDDHVYADFVCFERDLIVEVDNPTNVERAKDEQRNNFLENLGFEIMRFKDKEILGNPTACVAKIAKKIIPLNE